MCMKPTTDDIAGFGELKLQFPSPINTLLFSKGLEEFIRILDYTVGYRVIIIFILKVNTLL